MSEHNPELIPHPHPHPNEAIQPNAPDFVETPDVASDPDTHSSIPGWLYVVCGVALFLAGSSFTGFGVFGSGMLDSGLGGATLTSAGPVKAAVETPYTRGKKIYNGNCANCHQASGVGQPGSYPPLVASDVVMGNKERFAAVMLHGLTGPLNTKTGSYGTMTMPPWNSTFTDDQLADLMTYVRGSWGNTGNAVESTEVAAARTKFASKGNPFTQAELTQIGTDGPDPSDKK